MWGQPWRSPFPFVPSCCQWGELEAEPHWVYLLPKVHQTIPAEGEGPGSLGGCMLPWWGGEGSEHPVGQCCGLLPQPLGHAVPLTFAPQRLDSEALEWEEVACGVKLGTAQRLEGVGRVRGRAPPLLQDSATHSSSAQHRGFFVPDPTGWTMLHLVL